MEDHMKLEVIGREVIKPASRSTQNHCLDLSLMDFYSPASYLSTIFFYKDLAGGSSEMVSRRLKISLSKTLTRFYPLAGRIEDVSLNCNDEGAVFTEARTDLLLSDFLKNNQLLLDSLGEFLPLTAPEESAGSWPLLSVKVSFFGSGSGVAVTLAISHKICDASSMLTFAQDWAATTAKGGPVAVVTAPQFAETTIYPSPHRMQPPPMEDAAPLFEPSVKWVINRFIFKSSKISDLKRKAASESVPVPTRVEAISSLIWRCARNAARSNSAAPKSTLMSQAMDMRLRVPSNVLSPFAVGNLQSFFYLKKSAESEMETGAIVTELRKAKDGLNEIIKESLETSTLAINLLSVLGNLTAELNSGVDFYAMTSWCKKPFYEVDFGWGTPVWIGNSSLSIPGNVACGILMDSKDGEDVEAWVVLPKQDMAVFIRDQDLLTYGVLNPPVLI
ncbi:unnamed protein product [Eruca vesicaria subsp. sativa]|uniref:BAHD acyltransferase n=1 Tax=Eruca vesicaria subsp. sativa TaxID=29727 RepID=A0ABC8KUG4_ERUVS|nr:unnamed protein product [Eruca vesicaria subsp. sativa]